MVDIDVNIVVPCVKLNKGTGTFKVFFFLLGIDLCLSLLVAEICGTEEKEILYKKFDSKVDQCPLPDKLNVLGDFM